MIISPNHLLVTVFAYIIIY